jgi:hypothetical protein
MPYLYFYFLRKAKKTMKKTESLDEASTIDDGDEHHTKENP